MTKNKEEKRAGHLSVKIISWENSLRNFFYKNQKKEREKYIQEFKSKAKAVWLAPFLELYHLFMYGGKFALKKASLKKPSKICTKRTRVVLLNLPLPINQRTALFSAKSAIFFEPFPNFLIWKAGLCLPNQPVENGTNVSLSEPIG